MAATKLLVMFMFAALIGCHGTHRSDPAAAIVINLAFALPASCLVGIATQSFALPARETELLQALQRHARISTTATIYGGAETPYRCFGHAVYVAQRAGFERVGFIAEPPPAPAD